MRKQIISAFMTAALLSGLTGGVFANESAAEISLSPRAVVEISEGVVKGITEAVSALWLIGQFDCDVTVVDSEGKLLVGDMPVPSDSILKAEDTEARVVIPGDVDRDDVKDTLEAAKAEGVTYTKHWSTAKDACLPLAGLFARDGLPTDPESVPSLSQMTDLALERLSDDEDGFFLMVEGSKIDTYGHGNLFEDEMGEVYEFDCAVSVALRYVALNPDTVLIVTADHETGGLRVNPDSTMDNIYSDSYYTMKRHHWVNVPVYAVGNGTGILADTVENTDIAIFMGEVLGESIGARSNRYEMFDFEDAAVTDSIIELNPHTVELSENGLCLSFTKKCCEVILPLSLVTEKAGEARSIRAINITLKSLMDTSVILPALYLITPDGEIIVEEWWSFVKPGESVTQSYILPVELIGENVLGRVTELRIKIGKTMSYYFELTDITLVDRPLGK